MTAPIGLSGIEKFPETKTPEGKGRVYASDELCFKGMQRVLCGHEPGLARGDQHYGHSHDMPSREGV